MTSAGRGRVGRTGERSSSLGSETHDDSFAAGSGSWAEFRLLAFYVHWCRPFDVSDRGHPEGATSDTAITSLASSRQQEIQGAIGPANAHQAATAPRIGWRCSSDHGGAAWAVAPSAQKADKHYWQGFQTHYSGSCCRPCDQGCHLTAETLRLQHMKTSAKAS